MPKIIPIEEIEDGMIIAEPVINNYRQTLVKAGAELNKRHIALFKTWNVLQVKIKSGGEDEISELGYELQLLSKERLDKRMGWQPRNNIEKAVYEFGVKRAAQIITKSK